MGWPSGSSRGVGVRGSAPCRVKVSRPAIQDTRKPGHLPPRGLDTVTPSLVQPPAPERRPGGKIEEAKQAKSRLHLVDLFDTDDRFEQAPSRSADATIRSGPTTKGRPTSGWTWLRRNEGRHKDRPKGDRFARSPGRSTRSGEPGQSGPRSKCPPGVDQFNSRAGRGQGWTANPTHVLPSSQRSRR